MGNARPMAEAACRSAEPTHSIHAIPLRTPSQNRTSARTILPVVFALRIPAVGHGTSPVTSHGHWMIASSPISWITMNGITAR